MKILAIETSCDETSVSLVGEKDGFAYEIKSETATSANLHEKTGGVVPEVAARKQIESIVPVINEVIKPEEIEGVDYIAVTYGPGLIGSLLVGVEAAKSLAFSWDKPLVPVNHLVGHIYSNFMIAKGNSPKKIEFPCVALVVSGGHTDLVLMRDHFNFEYLGGTLDDAAGEAFDKVARMLGISKYLGGAKLSKLASTCENSSIDGVFPRPMLNKPDLNFSFSGLKTAVKRYIENNKYKKEEVAYEFESAAVDVLVKKTKNATQRFNVRCVLLGGGVSANKKLRAQLKYELDEAGVSLFVPPLSLCGDTAGYIGAAAYFMIKNGYEPVSLDKIKADPSLDVVS